MKFNLFRKPKQQSEQEKPVAPNPVEAQEPTPMATEEPKQESASHQMQAAQETVEMEKTYLKAIPLKELADVAKVKDEVNKGNIIILKVTPLASKSIEDVKNAVNELYAFSESSGGDIARLGEERVVICPKNIRIWREKSPASNEPLPTAA
jgi:SepF-like predicted cell division protein (DUF552 family)